MRASPLTTGWLGLSFLAIGLVVRVPTLAAPPDVTEIERLIQQLGSPKFAQREVATKHLDAIGEPALESLGKAATDSEDPEIRRRAQALVQTIEKRVYTEVRRWKAHIGFVKEVVFSPDGKRAVSGGLDGTVRLWNVQSGEEVRQFEGHEGVVNSVAFSADGQHLLSGGRDGVMRLWDAATGKELRRFEGHRYAVWRVAFSRHSRRVASGDGRGGERGVFRLWDRATGTELRRIEHEAALDQVLFSPDGKLLLTATIERAGPAGRPVLQLWDLETGRELRRFLGHQAGMRVMRAAFSPDGRRILSGSWDRTVRLWDAESGNELRCSVMSRHVYAVAFTPDGRQALAAEGDAVYLGGSSQNNSRGSATIQVWDPDSGKERHRFVADSVIVSLAVSPDGRYALSGNYDGTLRLWRLPK